MIRLWSLEVYTKDSAQSEVWALNSLTPKSSIHMRPEVTFQRPRTSRARTVVGSKGMASSPGNGRLGTRLFTVKYIMSCLPAPDGRPTKQIRFRW